MYRDEVIMLPAEAGPPGQDIVPHERDEVIMPAGGGRGLRQDLVV